MVSETSITAKRRPSLSSRASPVTSPGLALPCARAVDRLLRHLVDRQDIVAVTLLSVHAIAGGLFDEAGAAAVLIDTTNTAGAGALPTERDAGQSSPEDGGDGCSSA